MENNITEKKNFIDYILIAIVATYILLLLTSRFAGYSAKILIAGFGILLVALQVVSPVNNFLKKGQLKSRKAILQITANTALVATLIISGYEVFYTRNYNLKYTYWIMLTSLTLQIVIFFIEGLKNSYRKAILENKRYNFLLTVVATVLYLVFIGFQSYSLIYPFIESKHQMILDNFKVPDKIVIYKYGEDEKNNGFLGIGKAYEISSSEFIEKIMSELKADEVSNITSADLLNYQRMKSDNHPYYSMWFENANTGGIQRNLENGYIEKIVLTSNRTVVIEEENRKSDPFLIDKYYQTIHPVSFSEDTIDMFFRCVGNGKQKEF